MADAGCQMAYKGHVTDWVVVSRLRFKLFGVMLYTRVWLAVLMVSQAVSYTPIPTVALPSIIVFVVI